MALSLTDEEYRALIEMHSREIGDLTDQFTCAGSMPEANTTLDDIHERITRMTAVLAAWRGMRSDGMPRDVRHAIQLLSEDRSENEISPGSLERWSIENWDLIDYRLRDQCLQALNKHIPAVLQDHWADQHKRGVAIGSDSLAFHHGAGQNVRNILRAVLPDHQLPRVISGPDGKAFDQDQVPVTGNWDDFYLGALAALAADRLATPPTEQQPAPAAPGEDQ